MDDVAAWLLEGDPAIRWQVERDLLGDPDWQATKARVGTEGWGAALMAERDADGTWGGGLYSPKWTSTFYTLRLAAHFGLVDVRATESTLLLLDRGVAVDGTVRLWSGPRPDTCVAGMLLSSAVAFGVGGDERCRRIVARLAGEQMADGGWNCELDRGATHASMHTTLSVLEGLGAMEALPEATWAGREFLLGHRLYRSHRTGDVIRSDFTRFSFPPRWFYDVLRALEYLAAVDADWDERMADAVDLLVSKRGRDGRWTLQDHHGGREWFRMEEVGGPSRWNTLRASRVLAWAGRVRG